MYMTDSSSRYTVSGDNAEMQYVDEAQTVLVNKLGITNLEEIQKKEEELLADAYKTLIADIRTDTPLTCELLKHIHLTAFGRLYEWAGKWRSVQISKEGTTWPPPNHLDSAMQEFEREILAKYPAESLTDDENFCSAVGHIQGEFLAIHPFREGNARTIKLATNLLAKQTNRPFLLFDESESGKHHYIEAAKSAILKNFNPMIEEAQKALEEAKRAS